MASHVFQNFSGIQTFMLTVEKTKYEHQKNTKLKFWFTAENYLLAYISKNDLALSQNFFIYTKTCELEWNVTTIEKKEQKLPFSD